MLQRRHQVANGQQLRRKKQFWKTGLRAAVLRFLAQFILVFSTKLCPLWSQERACVLQFPIFKPRVLARVRHSRKGCWLNNEWTVEEKKVVRPMGKREVDGKMWVSLITELKRWKGACKPVGEGIWGTGQNMFRKQSSEKPRCVWKITASFRGF